MVKWNYIAKKLADKFARPGLGTWNKEHLYRTWNSLFDFQAERYDDESTMSGNYAIMYCFFMTLAHQPAWDDEAKVKAILGLLEEYAAASTELLLLGYLTGQASSPRPFLRIWVIQGWEAIIFTLK